MQKGQSNHLILEVFQFESSFIYCQKEGSAGLRKKSLDHIETWLVKSTLVFTHSDFGTYCRIYSDPQFHYFFNGKINLTLKSLHT